MVPMFFGKRRKDNKSLVRGMMLRKEKKMARKRCKNTTAKKINDGLIKNRITAAELSRRTGIGNASISNYVNGVTEPDPVRREMIFKVLGIGEEPEPEHEDTSKKRVRPPSSMSPTEAARLLGKGVPFVYEGLKDRRFTWGYAVKMPGGQWSYWISRKRFFEETGIKEIKNG